MPYVNRLQDLKFKIKETVDLSDLSKFFYSDRVPKRGTHWSNLDKYWGPRKNQAKIANRDEVPIDLMSKATKIMSADLILDLAAELQ